VRLARYLSPSTGTVHVGIVDGELITSIGDGCGRAGQRLLLAAAMDRSGRPEPLGDPEALMEATLRAPVPEPPSIRDFYAFEAHVATARRSRGLEMEPDWYALPVFYFSNPASVLGPDDVVVPPIGTQELDYELEVAAVIGVECGDVQPDRWAEVVAGFTIMNDWSARDLQRREMALGLGPAKGKDFATSLGPVLVTPEELLDADGPPVARMAARVNGHEWSRGELSDLHFGWGRLIAQASAGTRLRPGDVIGSGTVGTGCILELGSVHGRDRYPYLQPGDEVALEVTGIGVLANPVVERSSGIAPGRAGNTATMSDTSERPDPDEIREEVREDLAEMTEQAKAEEAERMAERDAEGVDEPS
jgi:2-keto-4-pentenoate hydratase/2-oxohepta-3-ene-1,7-dioic acid hydratase in catechol pathway